jgi:hypothetical protein
VRADKKAYCVPIGYERRLAIFAEIFALPSREFDFDPDNDNRSERAGNGPDRGLILKRFCGNTLR